MRRNASMAGIPNALLGALACACFVACGTATMGASTRGVGGLVQTATGEPLSEARVCVYREGAAVAETRTGSEGRFRVEIQGDEPVRIQVSKPCVTEPGTDSWRVLGASANDIQPGTLDIHLVSGEIPEDLHLRVRVLTSEGPLQDARVRTFPAVLPEGAFMHWLGRPHPTDKDGFTVQEYLTASPVEIRVLRQAPWCPARIPFALPEAEDAAGVREIRLVRERLVKGRVVDEDGRPVPLVGVMPMGSGPGHARAWGDLTGLDGSFCVGVPETWSSAAFRLGGDHPRDESSSLPAPYVALGPGGPPRPVRLTLPRPGRVEPPQAADAHPGPEAIRVIASVIRNCFLGEKTRAVLLVRSKRIDEYASEAKNHARLAGHVHSSALEDLRRKSIRPIPPPMTLPLDVPVLAVDDRWFEYLCEVHRDAGWPRFNARFSACTGLICVSAVGFSTDGDQAVLHVSAARGRLSAAAYYYVLELEGGVWKIVHRDLTWIS